MSQRATQRPLKDLAARACGEAHRNDTKLGHWYSADAVLRSHYSEGGGTRHKTHDLMQQPNYLCQESIVHVCCFVIQCLLKESCSAASNQATTYQAPPPSSIGSCPPALSPVASSTAHNPHPEARILTLPPCATPDVS